MSTPYDQRLLWLLQGGDSVRETRIAELADNIRRDTPNVAGLLLKTSHGAEWQGLRDSRPGLALRGPEAIRRQARLLGKSGLETHLCCVLRGRDVDAEARLVIEACRAPGARSMLLGFEAEPDGGYFSGGSARVARALITRIRAGIAPDFHLGLNFDARGAHPAAIHLREWAPFVQSLHPMIFHHAFGGGRHEAEPWLDQAFGTLERYGLPLIPMLQTWPQPGPVPPQQLLRAAECAWRKGAAGLSLFRYGAEGADAALLAALRDINPQDARIDADLPAAPERRVFRVSGTRPRARRLPRRDSATLAPVPRGTLVEVSADSRAETDGYVWWRSAQGWLPQGRSDRRHTLMVEVTPATPPLGLTLPATRRPAPPGRDAPSAPLKRFRVLANGLRVRSRPASGREFLRAAQLQRGDELLVDADAWTEQDGLRWWFHGTGWSAECAPDSGLRFLEDLTPEVARMNTAQPPLAQFRAQGDGLRTWDKAGEGAGAAPGVALPKRFRVLVPRLGVRSHPALAGTLHESRLSTGAVLEAELDAWVEEDGYVWWLHGPGWSAERSLDGQRRFLEDLTPAVGRGAEGARGRSATFPGAPPPRDERDRWQVLALTLPVHDAPGTSAVRSGRLRQGDVLRVPGDPARLVKADEYLWLRHGQGWSAVRRLDGRAEFLLNLDALPLLGALVQRHPVNLDAVNWVQYFGNTSFAWKRGREFSYHRYAQGLHSGLDYGCHMQERPGPHVFAAIEGISDGRGRKYGPNRLDVRVGPYRLIYGHLGSPANLPRKAPVTPQTVMGRIEHTLYHLHFEIRYRDTYILNPLLFMPRRMVAEFIARFPREVGDDDTHSLRFMQTESWDRWLTPLDQPVIRLGGEVIGPTAGL